MFWAHSHEFKKSIQLDVRMLVFAMVSLRIRNAAQSRQMELKRLELS